MDCNKDMAVYHNVQFRVIDRITGQTVQVYDGHNQATNTMLTGIAHYLSGNGVLGQGPDTLGMFVPRYISLGTMGLINQEQEQAIDDGEPVVDENDEPVYNGLPAGIGTPDTAEQQEGESDEDWEIRRFTSYMQQTPSYGSDGYATFANGNVNVTDNNGRAYLGLGPVFANRPAPDKTIDCELISNSFPRAKISYRSIIPAGQAEKPNTIDVIFSAMISTGALAQFREPDKNYLYITEAGLWSEPLWKDHNNGLLAGYRIAPPNENNWDMSIKANRDILKSQVIRVGINQVVQVIWKVQLGSIGQLNSRVYDTSIYIGKDGVDNG